MQLFFRWNCSKLAIVFEFPKCHAVSESSANIIISLTFFCRAHARPSYSRRSPWISKCSKMFSTLRLRIYDSTVSPCKSGQIFSNVGSPRRFSVKSTSKTATGASTLRLFVMGAVKGLCGILDEASHNT